MNTSSTGSGRYKTRAERVAAHLAYTGNFAQIWELVKNREYRLRILLVVVTSFAMCTVTGAWNPPQIHHESDIARWDIISRVPFVMETGPILTTTKRAPILDGATQVEEDASKKVKFAANDTLVRRGRVIDKYEFQTLEAEHKAFLETRKFHEKLLRFLGVFLITLAIFCVTSIFIQRRERRKPKSLVGMFYFNILMVATVIAASILHRFSENSASLELIPVLLFAQSIGIAFSWELAVVTTMIISFVVTISETYNFFSILLMLGITASIVIHLGRLRSRTKLIVIGLFGAVVAFFLTLCICMVEDRPLDRTALVLASMNGLWTIAAGFLMTGLLPFIERPFGILTDMSLLELGHPSHPLLYELNRRAPSTYSHSMQVGSIAESAAEAIGARGLLVQVGAYFHDIGKILNPDFFTENQSGGYNVHDTLEPRVSTLVIVSHVKDGADLARQHKIPIPIVQLIEQHHGTSLVSFFYDTAVRQSREQGYTNPIDDGSYRYPGPKPQTKEAGILMLADAAESACCSLGDAPPGKIEGMVRHVADQKLKDGQFDESGLTLKELRTIENSIIKSLLAIRHGRIRYPDQNDNKVADTSPRGKTPESLKTETNR